MGFRGMTSIMNPTKTLRYAQLASPLVFCQQFERAIFCKVITWYKFQQLSGKNNMPVFVVIIRISWRVVIFVAICPYPLSFLWWKRSRSLFARIGKLLGHFYLYVISCGRSIITLSCMNQLSSKKNVNSVSM